MNLKLRPLFTLLALTGTIFLTPVSAQRKCSHGEVASVYGKIQFVSSFPDYKVQIVTSFPDLKVQRVTSFPDSVGKWQTVESFPDFKIQIVESFPDLKVQYVESFPGVSD